MLELTDLVKTHDAFELGPIDLAVEDEVLSVLGPSGSGKTTLLSVIAGVNSADTGAIVLDGTQLTGLPPEDRDVVLVFQDGALFPHMTVKENISYGATSRKRVEELTDTLELSGVVGQPAATLSGGERQRVALARALATDPAALLLDEPLSNLDTPIRRRLRHELRDLLVSLSIPVMYVTHDQRDATVISDRIAVIENGEILQCDTPVELLSRPETPFVASFTGNTNVFRARVSDENELVWNGRRIRAHVNDCIPGESVRFCIRPEHVSVITEQTEHTNAFDATITRRTFNGSSYHLTVVLDHPSESVRLTLPPLSYDRLGLAHHDHTQIEFDMSYIHLMRNSDKNAQAD